MVLSACRRLCRAEISTITWIECVDTIRGGPKCPGPFNVIGANENGGHILDGLVLAAQTWAGSPAFPGCERLRRTLRHCGAAVGEGAGIYLQSLPWVSGCVVLGVKPTESLQE